MNRPVTQGTKITMNPVFRSYRYPLNYPAFEDKDLLPQGPIELGSSYSCELFIDTDGDGFLIDEDGDGLDVLTAIQALDDIAIYIYPNPASDFLYVEVQWQMDYIINIFDLRDVRVSSHSNEPQLLMYQKQAVGRTFSF